MLNSVTLMGRLVADPELKTTQNGTSVASFRLAVERNYQPKGAAEKQADFIPCVAWRQTAEFIGKYFAKGRMIAVEGSLQSRNYEDKNGQKRTAIEVIVERVHFTGERVPASAGQASAPPASAARVTAEDNSTRPHSDCPTAGTARQAAPLWEGSDPAPADPPAAPPPVPAGDPAAAYVQAAQYGLPGDVHYRGTLDVDFAEDDPYSGDLPF